MIATRYIPTAALALGAVLLATTALPSPPAEAFSGNLTLESDGGTIVHAAKRGGPPTGGGIPPPPGKNYIPFDPPTFNNNNGGKLGPTSNQKNPDRLDPNRYGPTKLPTPSGSQKNANAFDPNSYVP